MNSFDEKKLTMWLEVTKTMQSKAFTPLPLRIDLLADFFQRDDFTRMELPVFLRRIWGPEHRPALIWRQVVEDIYCPSGAVDISFWLMMARITSRQRAELASPILRELTKEHHITESIQEWKDCMYGASNDIVIAASEVLLQRPHWKMSRNHINSVLELVGVSEIPDGYSDDLLER